MENIIVLQPCNSTGKLAVTVDGCAGSTGDPTAAIATFTFTVTPPITGCTYKWDLGDGSPIITTMIPTLTASYPTAGTYTATVVATCPSPGGGSCTVQDSVTVDIPSCDEGKECPTVTDLIARVDGCAEPGLATVTVSGTLTPPLAGCQFLWAYKDDPLGPVLNETTSIPSISISLSKSGDHTISVTAICPGIPPCATEQITVHVDACCPKITKVLTSYRDQCGKKGKKSTVNFIAIMEPEIPTPEGTWRWQFGDEHTGDPLRETNIPTVSHDYDGEPNIFYPVAVKFIPKPAKYPNCPESTAHPSEAVHFEDCEGGPPNGNEDEEEGGFCFALRIIMTLAAILAIVVIALIWCIPETWPYLKWVLLGTGITAALAGLIWGFFCNKPCGSALLVASEIAIGAGILLLCYSNCCKVPFSLAGGGLLVLGLAGMLWWKSEDMCNKSFCEVANELAIVLSVIVIPFLDLLKYVPQLKTCKNEMATTAFFVMEALVSIYALKCRLANPGGSGDVESTT